MAIAINTKGRKGLMFISATVGIKGSSIPSEIPIKNNPILLLSTKTPIC